MGDGWGGGGGWGGGERGNQNQDSDSEEASGRREGELAVADVGHEGLAEDPGLSFIVALRLI